MSQRRLLYTQASTQMNTITNLSQKWRIKQVTNSNFKQVLQQFQTHLVNSDFIAVSLQKTGSFSAPWQRVLPFDSAQIAYFKSKRSAERFQMFQLAICPFTLTDSKLTAYPYNFHLFPRDELKLGMPSYSFYCQTSYLTSMARLGFDFNTCIYDGISYLSRAQESTMKHLAGNALFRAHLVQSSPPSSVADSIFTERIKSRVTTWRKTFKDSKGQAEDPVTKDLINSLRKVVLGEDHGSRPSMDIDVCSERQVQLVLEVLKGYSDDIVPLLVPTKRGGTQGVRIILTSSKKDKIIYEKELQDQEEEQSKRVRGFREVIDMISASHKPIVTHNSLDDFTFINSNFLSPLPPTIDEFKVSLNSVFPCIIDLGHLMKEISPLRSMKSLPEASSFLKNRFFAPIDIDIPLEGDENEMKEGKIHGQNVLTISHLFAKLCYVLKRNRPQLSDINNFTLKDYANIFYPCYENPLENSNEDVKISSGSVKKLSCNDLVFLWGFRHGSSPSELKNRLIRFHKAFSGDFDVKLVDKSCAVVAFWQPGLAVTLIDAMNTEETCTKHQGLKKMMSEGLKCANYETYKNVCEMGLWNSSLADSFDQVLRSIEQFRVNSHQSSPYEILWDDNTMVNLDEL